MSELIGESHIKHEIVHKHYIQMHKAELQLIIMKNDIFGTFTFWFDKIGTIGIGIIIKMFMDGTFNLQIHGYTLFFTVIAFCSGIYYSRKKSKNIDAILKEKMNSIK